MKLEEMTRPQVEAYLKKDNRIIIPLGAIEQHGVGLPLGTDFFVAEALSSKIAQDLKIIRAPTIRPGLSLVPHLAFKGTISLTSETLHREVKEYVKSLHTHGFRKFIFLSAHGGNDGVLLNLSQELAMEFDEAEYLILDDWWKIVPDKFRSKFSSYGHADSEEASVLAAIREDLVDWKAIKKDTGRTKPPKMLVSLKNIKKKLTKTGSINGNQSETNIEVGKEIFNWLIKVYEKRIIKTWS